MLVRIAGALMLGVFIINVYIGIDDSNLSQLNSVHYLVNWVIAAADLVAAILLFVKPRSLALKSLGGIVWPLAYIATLFIDVETKLCLGTNTHCFPTTSDAYRYLILGSAAESWELWPYTIRLAIGLQIAILVLTVVSILLFRTEARNTMMKKQAPQPGMQRKDVSQSPP
jgi:hypothetical protein